MPSTIAELRATVDEYEKRVTDFAEAGKVDEAHEATGALAAYRQMLLDETMRIDEENKRLAEQMKNVGGSDKPKTVGEMALGEKAAFDSIAPGWKAKVTLATLSIMNTATTLNTPVTVDTNLPGLVRPPMGFLDTITRGVTNGDEKYFLPPVLTNAAAGWVTGSSSAKPESAIAWTEHTSNLETIAHWIPVHKQMVRRYNSLESQISNSLMLGLEMKRAEMVITGDNSNGIIGAINFPGILEFTKNSSDNIVDTLADMAVRCRIASGYSPNYCALSPNAIRAIAKTKAEDGHYLFPNFKAGDVIPGTNMVAIEDQNMTITTVIPDPDEEGPGEETTKTTEAAMVYFNGVITYKVADPDQVEIGLTDKQFINNAYTMLGEGTGLLRIDNPAAICYCADLGITVQSE